VPSHERVRPVKSEVTFDTLLQSPAQSDVSLHVEWVLSIFIAMLS